MEIPAIVGGGLIVIGVGIGIGGIGRGAMEAIGRQPDAYGKIQVDNCFFKHKRSRFTKIERKYDFRTK